MYRGRSEDNRSILHLGKFYPPHSGGIETHVRDLATRQARSADVSVIVANKSARRETAAMDGVRVTRLATLGTIASMPICPGLPIAIRKIPADLVHLHVPNPGAAAAFLASGHKGKLVITHHADTLGRESLRRLSDPVVAAAMRRASSIIVTSSRYLLSSAELAPYREKCRVIPMGIDTANHGLTSEKDVRALHAKYGERLVLAIGRQVPYKGFDILIRAMRGMDARLLLIGAGPLAEQLAALVVAEGLEEQVTMLRRVADLGPYLAAASVFVLPSITRAEAFGLVQLEAMAAGLPVINTDIDSGVPEVSVDGETGRTVPPGNVAALAHAMREILDDGNLRRKFGDAARVRIEAEFNADRMAERTEKLYDEVLSRNSALPN